MNEAHTNALVGKRVWFWHFGKLNEGVVTAAFFMQGQDHVRAGLERQNLVLVVVTSGFATPDFYSTRNEAVEAALSKLAKCVARWGNTTPQSLIENTRAQPLIEMAKAYAQFVPLNTGGSSHGG